MRRPGCPMPKTRVVIEGDLTVKMVKNLLEGLPVSWRLVGQEDGSIVVAPGRRATALDLEEDEDEEMSEEMGNEH